MPWLSALSVQIVENLFKSVSSDLSFWNLISANLRSSSEPSRNHNSSDTTPFHASDLVKGPWPLRACKANLFHSLMSFHSTSCPEHSDQYYLAVLLELLGYWKSHWPLVQIHCFAMHSVSLLLKTLLHLYLFVDPLNIEHIIVFVIAWTIFWYPHYHRTILKYFL